MQTLNKRGAWGVILGMGLINSSFVPNDMNPGPQDVEQIIHRSSRSYFGTQLSTIAPAITVKESS
jgi:hypothetical protein